MSEKLVRLDNPDSVAFLKAQLYGQMSWNYFVAGELDPEMPLLRVFGRIIDEAARRGFEVEVVSNEAHILPPHGTGVLIGDVIPVPKIPLQN